MELMVVDVFAAPKVRLAPGLLWQVGDLGEESHSQVFEQETSF